jgi:hypothetical protein
MQQRETSEIDRTRDERPAEQTCGPVHADTPEVALIDVTVRGGPIVAAFAAGRISRSEAMAQLRAAHLGTFGEQIRA